MEGSILLVRLFSRLFEVTKENASMHYERVHSKSVTEIGYDSNSRTLGIIYNNGLVFSACNFPKPDFDRLRNSEFDQEFPRIVLANFELQRTGRRAPMFN